MSRASLNREIESGTIGTNLTRLTIFRDEKFLV